jgi:dienelactone hydrolase
LVGWNRRTQGSALIFDPEPSAFTVAWTLPFPRQPGAIKAKILVCHGALDPHVPITQVNAFVEEMNRASTDYQLIVYGSAMHGFTHEAGLKMPGVQYNAPADHRSSAAIHNFLTEAFASSND